MSKCLRLRDTAVKSSMSFVCIYQAIIVFPGNDKVIRKGCPDLASLERPGLVWSTWETMKGHSLGVRLMTYQLSNPNHFTSPDLSLHICEMGIINLSSKVSLKDEIILFFFSQRHLLGSSDGRYMRGSLKPEEPEGRLFPSSLAQLATAWVWFCLFTSIPSTRYCLMFPLTCVMARLQSLHPEYNRV